MYPRIKLWCINLGLKINKSLNWEFKKKDCNDTMFILWMFFIEYFTYERGPLGIVSKNLKKHLLIKTRYITAIVRYSWEWTSCPKYIKI